MQPVAVKRDREPLGVGYTRDEPLRALSSTELERGFDASVDEVLAVVKALGVDT